MPNFITSFLTRRIERSNEDKDNYYKFMNLGEQIYYGATKPLKFGNDDQDPEQKTGFLHGIDMNRTDFLALKERERLKPESEGLRIDEEYELKQKLLLQVFLFEKEDFFNSGAVAKEDIKALQAAEEAVFKKQMAAKRLYLEHEAKKEEASMKSNPSILLKQPRWTAHPWLKGQPHGLAGSKEAMVFYMQETLNRREALFKKGGKE